MARRCISKSFGLSTKESWLLIVQNPRSKTFGWQPIFFIYVLLFVTHHKGQVTMARSQWMVVLDNISSNVVNILFIVIVICSFSINAHKYPPPKKKCWYLCFYWFAYLSTWSKFFWTCVFPMSVLIFTSNHTTQIGVCLRWQTELSMHILSAYNAYYQIEAWLKLSVLYYIYQ